jgi:hypothetical protein
VLLTPGAWRIEGETTRNADCTRPTVHRRDRSTGQRAGAGAVLVLTLATATGEQIAFERRHLVAVVASHPGSTLIRLTDGRRFLVRETFVDVLYLWRTDRQLY